MLHAPRQDSISILFTTDIYKLLTRHFFIFLFYRLKITSILANRREFFFLSNSKLLNQLKMYSWDGYICYQENSLLSSKPKIKIELKMYSCHGHARYEETSL